VWTCWWQFNLQIKKEKKTQKFLKFFNAWMFEWWNKRHHRSSINISIYIPSNIEYVMWRLWRILTKTFSYSFLYLIVITITRCVLCLLNNYAYIQHTLWLLYTMMILWMSMMWCCLKSWKKCGSKKIALSDVKEMRDNFLAILCYPLTSSYFSNTV
jgi:hypothetical protein